MKKPVSLRTLSLCILLALALVLTGCSGGTTGATDKPAQTTKVTEKPTQATPDVETLEPYEVIWYRYDTASQPDEKIIEDAIGEYLKDKINTTVDIVIPTDYNTQVRAAISAGEKIDLMFSCSWIMYYVEMAREGWAVEITDEMLETYAPHALEVLSGPFIDGSKVDGKLYHLACNKELGTSYGVLLNKELVDKYDMDISTIQSYHDLGPFFQTIKDNEPNVYPTEEGCGYMFRGNWNPNFMYIHQPMGEDEWVTVLDMPINVELLQTAKQYYDAGYIREDALTGGLDVIADMKAGIVFSNFCQLKPGKDKEMTVTTGVEWVQVDLVDYPVVTDTSGSMMCIPVTADDPNRVLMFYDFFYYDRDIITLYNRGIENVHYVFIDENTVGYAPDTNNGADSGWTPAFSIWQVGNQFINYVFEGEDPDKYEQFIEFNSQCRPYESVGFLVDVSDPAVQNMYDRLAAAGGDVYNLLQLGMAGDVQTAVDQQLATWNEAGLQDVLAEINRQYQEWLALQ